MRNLSIIDKLLRIALMVILALIAHFYSAELGNFYWLIIIVNIYLVASSFFSFCHIYYVLGLSSYRRKLTYD